VIRPQTAAGFAGLHRKQFDLEVPLSVQVRPFRISEVDLDSECREVRVEGDLDLSVADQLQKSLDAAALDDVEVFVCLEQCDFIDSTGIAAIVSAHKLMTSRGRRLFICNPSGQVSRILAITGLNDVGFVYPSIGAALAELQPGGSARTDELKLTEP
jgi:anti-sigma B factor antagonist